MDRKLLRLGLFLFLVALVTALPSGGVALAAPPPNDNLADAAVIASLPFNAVATIDEATTEAGEPFFCSYFDKTVWYTYTPAADIWVEADPTGRTFSANVNIYRSLAPGFSGLTNVQCGGGAFSVKLLAGTTYYFQTGSYSQGTLALSLKETPPPPPNVNFFASLSDPSVYDTLTFSASAWDPYGMPIQSYQWDLGDGATGTGPYVTHHYATDGDYTVKLTTTTTDGRSGSATQTITVKTRDVAIVGLATPNSGKVGQTRPITVDVRNRRAGEMVQVQLFRSAQAIAGYDGWAPVGQLTLFVAEGIHYKAAPFRFSYTFTDEDALVGKVSFKAVATILPASGCCGPLRDALPADNTAISPATKVTR